MNFRDYKLMRIPQINISHPDLTDHRQVIDMIMSEWQEKLKNNINLELISNKKYKPNRFNARWDKNEEDKMIDLIIQGKSHIDIAKIHKRTIGSIRGRLYKIAIKLIKDNNTTIDDIVTIFDLDRNILISIINKHIQKNK
jgi:TATA-box binding protein (TBP) (component of TFIID and TFIIIB)